MEKKFRLNSTDDIEKFEKNLEKHLKKETHFQISTYFNLKEWFKYCLEDKEYGARIFTAVLDLKICFALTEINFLKSKVNWNTNFANKENTNFSVLDNFRDFDNSFNILNNITSFIYNYRATWDKIFGLLILLNIPNEYDKYRRAKSRKNKFKNLCKTHNIFSPSFVNPIFKLLENFDRKYRTPEAHSTGALRNWVLNPKDYLKFSFDNPNYEISFFWNDLVKMISDIEEDFLNYNG